MAEWLALEAIEPWGEKRADYRAAMICWVFACCFSSRSNQPRFSKFLKLFDFAEQPEQDDEQISQMLTRMVGRGKK